MSGKYSHDRKKKKHLIYRYKSRAYETFKAFKKFSPKVNNPIILDFGSADGFTLSEIHLLLNAKSSLGVEYSQELINSSEELPSNCSVIQGDVTKSLDQIKTESYDLVTALAILEHLDEPVELFRQAYRNLKPGGLLVATCPSPIWDKISGKFNLHDDDFHAFDFNRKEFSILAIETGFETLQYRKFMSAPLGFAPYLHIPMSPVFSHFCDRIIGAFSILNWVFVNQIFIARKVGY